jgi:hypothetical protein
MLKYILSHVPCCSTPSLACEIFKKKDKKGNLIYGGAFMKKLWILTIILVLGFIVNSCGGNEEKPIPCLCPDEVAHLGIGEATCKGEPCKHNCTEQITVIIGTEISIRKQSGVTVTQMNKSVENINIMYGMLSGGQKGTFAIKVTEVKIIPGSVVNLSETILEVGNDTTVEDIYIYLVLNSIV